MVEACERLERTVSVSDAQNFHASTFQDVYNTIREIEHEHAARKKLRNTRRIKPFLDRVQQYTKCAEILHNETQLLQWVWGPARMMIQAASECVEALDKLLEEFSRIGAVLPELNTVDDATSGNFAFQHALAMIYVDLLAFYERIFAFFTMPGMPQSRINSVDPTF